MGSSAWNHCNNLAIHFQSRFDDFWRTLKAWSQKKCEQADRVPKSQNCSRITQPRADTMKMDTPNWIRYFVLCGLILANHSICKFRIHTISPPPPIRTYSCSARIHHRTSDASVFVLECAVNHLCFVSKWMLVTCCAHEREMDGNGRECARKIVHKQFTFTRNSNSLHNQSDAKLTDEFLLLPMNNWSCNCMKRISQSIAYPLCSPRNSISLARPSKVFYIFFGGEWKTGQSYGNNVDVGSPSFHFHSFLMLSASSLLCVCPVPSIRAPVPQH